jgi:hypothetical protein
MAPAAVEPWDVKQKGIAPVIVELFLNHSGLMHMNGSWPEQFGFSSPTDGGWLPAEFFDYCRMCPTGRPTWRCMDRMMDQRLGDRFQRDCNGRYVEEETGYVQTSLKTISWSFPENIEHSTSRFGVIGDDSYVKTGVRVTQMEQDSPARGVLHKGDLILTINGKEVKDTVSFFDLVRSSSIKMRLTYRRSGTTNSGDVTLRW